MAQIKSGDMRFFVLTLICALSFTAVSAQKRVTQEHKDRAAAIVSQMTLEEKIKYVAGYKGWYIMPVERLGLPAVRMADGPQGVRNKTKSTLYPCGIAAAATWNKELIEKMGVALGQDARARGVHILLGPGANIYRSPLCGRNFEYFGEDPYLAGQIAANYIKGVQSQDVMACIKHFAGNNQEYNRHAVSSDIDERTLHEIYFPAFEMAVKEADVATVMTSYNLLNGIRPSESKYLNYDVLRDEWGFEGIVISDWRSCYSPLNVATWGIDLEMPSPKCMTPEVLQELIGVGALDVRYLDRKCQHIVQTILAYGFDKRDQKDASIPENNPYSDKVSHELSREAIVMLRNEDDFLPVRKGNFVVCGPNADRIVTGGGSGFVEPILTTSVAEGMTGMNKKVKCTVLPTDIRDNLDNVYTSASMTEKGVKVEFFSNNDLAGEPVKTYVTDKVYLSNSASEAHDDLVMTNVSSRHTFFYSPACDESLKVYASGNDGIRLYINGEQLVEKWGGINWNRDSFLYDFKKGETYEFVVEHFNGTGSIGLEVKFENIRINDPDLVKKADCVVVCLGHDSLTEKENFDRTFDLPAGQVEYLRKILALNDNVVVVLNAGGGVEMTPWISDVKAVLMAWYPGQQGGLAVSEIITGKVSPSGKLPVSIEKKLEDNPSYANYYENVDRVRTPDINPYSRVEYREGVFMGYRGYEWNGVQPLFPFGYGLSYTSFGYSDICVVKDGEGFMVTFDVTNTGKVAGAEVAQLYVSDDKSSVLRPLKELKGFEKVFLNPGQTKTVTIRLDASAFRFYNTYEHRFVVEPGTFTIKVGSSSADIRLVTSLTL